MKRIILSAVVGITSLLNVLGAEEPVEQRELTEVRQLTRGTVELIPTETSITTTVSLPGPIEAMDGKGFVSDDKNAGLFELSFTPGSSRFSVNPLQKGVKSNMNIVVGGSLYTLYFVERQGAGVFSVEFLTKKSTSTAPKKRNLLVSPQRLVGLLDKCKSYPLLVGTHPEVVDDIETASPNRTIDNGNFDVVLRNVYRKHDWDTVVFHIELINKSDKPIYYDPESWTARVNDEVYYQSVGDSSGIINPKSKEEAWFAVTGDQVGGANELHVDNPFQVAVQTTDSPPKLAPAPNSILQPFYSNKEAPARDGAKAVVALETPKAPKK